MSCATATFDEASPFAGYLHSLNALSRVACRGIAVTVATAAVACVAAGLITMAAAWVVSVAVSISAHVFATGPSAMEVVGVADPYRMRGDAAYRAGPARMVGSPIYAIDPVLVEVPPRAVAVVSEPLMPADGAEQPNGAIAPPSGQLDAPHGEATHRVAVLSVVEDPPAPVAATGSIRPLSVLQASLPAKQPDGRSLRLPELTARTAIYDIKAHTVYMPNGERLEAHSGLGHRRDNPRYVREKNKGPTPPNVYDLKMRERRFHGVRAIRLNPVAGSEMFGRDGMLAHTYMLGRSGQSFGCVSFKDYNAFLRAFLRGEVDRLVVVPYLETAPSAVAAARPSASEQ